MTLLWPEFLLILTWLPLLAGAYLWFEQRKRKKALRYSSLALIRAARPQRLGLRRRVPLALFLLAQVCLIFSLARPARVIYVPMRLATIVLVIDVSASMGLKDIPPDRLTAAENAALAFLQDQGPDIQIGVVAFSTSADLVIPPTTDHQSLKLAIQSLSTGANTAIGSGIYKGLDAIAETQPVQPPGQAEAHTGGGHNALPVEPGGHHVIILLTDGANNCGPAPMGAAEQAAARAVRVYTIGYGPRDHDNLKKQHLSIQGGINTVRDEEEQVLKSIASITGGKYYAASSGSDLSKVFDRLTTREFSQPVQQEFSAIFAAAGALLAASAVVLSLLWHPLP